MVMMMMMTSSTNVHFVIANNLGQCYQQWYHHYHRTEKSCQPLARTGTGGMPTTMLPRLTSAATWTGKRTSMT